MEDGYLQLGTVRGVPIRLHWSTALGALFFSRFKFAPAFWLGFVLLVLVHELGHAWVAQRLGHRALAIEVTGFGGLCKWDARRASGLHRSLVAWGGVFFQAILLAVAYVYEALAGPVGSLYEAQLLSVFTDTNIFLIGLNLLPFPPLDGAEAWNIIHQLRRRRR
jgi:stage IV sporulation protein FB